MLVYNVEATETKHYLMFSFQLAELDIELGSQALFLDFLVEETRLQQFVVGLARMGPLGSET